MRSRPGALLAAGLAAAAVAVVPSAASADAFSWSSLTITKTGTTPSGPLHKQVTLRCEPTGGTHPTAEVACGRLIAVNGQFDRLPRFEGVGCGGVWQPVTVTVTGTWRLRPVSFSETYGNDCVATIESNEVFRF